MQTQGSTSCVQKRRSKYPDPSLPARFAASCGPGVGEAVACPCPCSAEGSVWRTPPPDSGSLRSAVVGVSAPRQLANPTRRGPLPHPHCFGKPSVWP